jgi:hypothetical protein
MIWAVLSIGLTVLLAVWTARPQAGASALSSPGLWLVLPDEPRPVPALALPAVIPAGSFLPAVIVTYPAWSSSQAWRADKPLKPWFRNMAPYAVATVFGATSLDLTALGLGLPEIASPSLFDGQPAPHLSSAAGLGLDADLSALFGSAHNADFGMDSFAWDQSDLMTPAWQQPYEPSHDWWA